MSLSPILSVIHTVSVGTIVFQLTHKVGNIGIIANFVFPYIYVQFPSLFAHYHVTTGWEWLIRTRLIQSTT